MTLEEIEILVSPYIEHPLLEGSLVVIAPRIIGAQQLAGESKCESLRTGSKVVIGKIDKFRQILALKPLR